MTSFIVSTAAMLVFMGIYGRRALPHRGKDYGGSRRRLEAVMVKWAGFAEVAPRLAELGRQRLEEPGVVPVGSIRWDGTPRISPVEPLLWDGDLWLSMLFGSRKAADLRRDERVLVHSIVTGRGRRTG